MDNETPLADPRVRELARRFAERHPELLRRLKEA